MDTGSEEVSDCHTLSDYGKQERLLTAGDLRDPVNKEFHHITVTLLILCKLKLLKQYENIISCCYCYCYLYCYCYCC